MMQFGGLEIPMEWRRFLAPAMGTWSDLAEATGKFSMGGERSWPSSSRITSAGTER
jgi:hypothetical protein